MNKEKRWDQLGEVRVRIIKAKSFLLTNYDPKGTLTYFRAFFKSFGEKAEVFGRYKSIGDTDLSATFSRHGLMESIKKSADMTVFPHVLMNIGSLLNSAIEIKRFLQERDNEHIKAWHILISVLEFGDDLFLVEILVKEMKNPEENSVYLITNKEKVDSVSRTGTDPNAPTESTCTITIDDLAKKVNGSTMLEFHDFSSTHRIIDASRWKNPDGIYAGLAENATFGTLSEKGGCKPRCHEKRTPATTS